MKNVLQYTSINIKEVTFVTGYVTTLYQLTSFILEWSVRMFRCNGF
jgi:hypothetical protein